MCFLGPILVLQEWWDVGVSNPVRSWHCACGPNPFKKNEGNPLRSVIGLNAPHRVRPDQMHVFAYGYGKDFSASSVVLACRLGVFPGRSLQARMDSAFDAFKQWCTWKKKSTSLASFDHKVFKMGQYPVCKRRKKFNLAYKGGLPMDPFQPSYLAWT